MGCGSKSIVYRAGYRIYIYTHMEAQGCKQCQQKSPSSAPDEEFCWLQRHWSSRNDQPHTRAERGCKKKKPKQVPGCLSFPCSLWFTKELHRDMRGDVFSKAVSNVECKACRQAHRSGRISQQRFQPQWRLQSSPTSSTPSCVISLTVCCVFQCLACCPKAQLIPSSLQNQI